MQEIIILLMHFSGIALLACAATCLALRSPSKPTIVAALGFVTVAITQITMNIFPNEVAYQYDGGELSGFVVKTGAIFTISRIISGVGYLLGSASLLWYALRVIRAPNNSSKRTRAKPRAA